jgi:hypothetical protein
MTSSSPVDMRIEFKTLIFHSRPEEQLQERIIINRFRKYVTSAPAVIDALGYTLGPHPKSNLDTYLYFGSTSIAIIDESNRRISFNRLNKFDISLSATIGAMSSPLGPRPERDLATYLNSSSTLITIKTSSIVGSVSDDFKKATPSLQDVTKAYDSPPGTPPKIDLTTYLYSGSALAAHYDEMAPFDSSDIFRSLNT